MDLTKTGFIVGFIGDIGLQLFDQHPTKHGLRDYFKQHGMQESAMLASFLTGGWMYVYEYILKYPPQLVPIIVYAFGLDELYRQFYSVLYPSLNGYYKNNSRIATLVYNGIVGSIVYGTYKLLDQ